MSNNLQPRVQLDSYFYNVIDQKEGGFGRVWLLERPLARKSVRSTIVTARSRRSTSRTKRQWLLSCRIGSCYTTLTFFHSSKSHA